jgi:hypothetical protein
MPKGKTCARCMTPTPAATTGSFSYEGVPYEIPLCAKHATMFDSDMVGWLRLASEVEPPKKVQPLQTARRYEGGPPIRMFIPPAPVREVVLDDDEPEPPEPPDPPPDLNLSDFAKSFTLTRHAIERMNEREVHVLDVYRLIDSPSKTRSAKGGTHIYRNHDLKVIVSESARSIITVARAEELI